MRYLLMAVAGCLFIMATGCGSSKDSTSLTPDERWERAKQALKNEDYLDAIEDLKIITVQFQGSGYGDSAQFYLAESYYKRKEFILAQYEFENLVRTRPGSKLLPRARYQLGMCYYRLSSQSSLDQQNTRKAIDAFQSFLEYNPADSLVPNVEGKIRELNNKLAEREFKIAELYMRMDFFRAAVIYYDAVLEKYHDSDLADDAQLGKARALFMRKKYPEARDEIAKFFERYPSSDRRNDGDELKTQIDSKLKGLSSQEKMAQP